MTAVITTVSDRPAGTRRGLMLAVLLLGQFMALLDTSIVNVAMPAIGAGFHASGAWLQLIVGGYLVAYAMTLITGARLGDLYGRRRMFLTGAILFTLASLACGLAPAILPLVLFRFVQGIAAAIMVPQIMSLIQAQFSGPARAKALSAYGVTLSAGQVAGLIAGGLLVGRTSSASAGARCSWSTSRSASAWRSWSHACCPPTSRRRPAASM